ncbi:MAG: efflux RND transporter periplasmic adaptor subunit [Candidatus Latescibacteria bacterium]|nr:efflux RND transporter periplasmic adaptor subunit [Candidatus Latescibacterota bacterium]
MSPFPKLRSDLVCREQHQHGRVWFVLKDPMTNKYFRCTAFQYSVATRLDGNTSLSAIQASLSERLGKPVRLESLETFVSRLARFGLIEQAGAPESTDQDASRPPFLRRLLYIKLRAFDPGRLFDRLYPWFAFCFSSAFVVFSIGIVLLAAWGLASDWEGWVGQFHELVRLKGTFLLSLYVILSLILTVHELAHGLACRHFGGEVHEAGFLLIYFQPCFYTDVSDVWLFRTRRERMLVMLAGVYSGMLVWAGAALVWRVTAPETSLNHVSFLVMVVAGTSLLFNFNPLLKFDGYYLLSDLVGIPNLRQKAFGYLSARVKAMLVPSSSQAGRVSPRERRLYVSYGLLACLYSAGLIGSLLFQAEEFLVANYQELGVVGFLLLMGAVLGQPVKEATRVTGAVFREHRSRFIAPRNLLLLAGGGIVILGGFFIRMELRVSSSCQLRAVERAVVRARIAGQLDSLYVEEGDTVQAGRVLARLSTRDLDAELRTVQARRAQAQAQLALLKKGARPEEIEQARFAVEQAQTSLHAAENAFNRASALAQQRVIAAEALDAARTELAIKQAEAEQARSQLNLLLAGSRPESIDAVNAEVRGLTATLDHLHEQKRLTGIVSPMAGVITTRFLKEKRDAYVAVGDTICELVDQRRMLVEMPVPEREVGDVREGFPVKLKVQGFPSMSFFGTVTAIAPTATEVGGRQTVLVQSRLLNETGVLKPGMTGNAKIYCGQRRIGALVLRRVVRYIRTEFWW